MLGGVPFSTTAYGQAIILQERNVEFNESLDLTHSVSTEVEAITNHSVQINDTSFTFKFVYYEIKNRVSNLVSKITRSTNNIKKVPRNIDWGDE